MNNTRVHVSFGLLILMVFAVGGVTSADIGDDGPPVVTQTWSPKIPPQAENAGSAGSVTLLVLVRPDGSVGPTTVMDCEPCDLGFEASARQSLSKWGFYPAREYGEFVEAYTVVEIDFQSVSVARRARYRDRDWSFVSVANGGTFRKPRWNRLTDWQLDQLRRRRQNLLHESQWWSESEFAGVLPFHPWYWGNRSGVLKSPVKYGNGYLPWPAGKSEEAPGGYESIGTLNPRAAAGPQPVQLVGSPGVVRPTGFDRGASRTFVNRQAAGSTTRGSMTSMTHRSRPSVTTRALVSPTRSVHARSSTTHRATAASPSRTRKK